MSRGTKVINSSIISLAPLAQVPLPIKLSLFDSIFVGIQPLQKLMLFSSPTITLPFPTIVQYLKSSLSSTLVDFLPLAGKLTHVPSTGDVEIDLSDPSFTFIEAESDLDICQLAADETHDIESFVKLVPKIDTTEMPFAVLAVQPLIESPCKPHYDRAMIDHPNGEAIARQILRDTCPILPATRNPRFTSFKAEIRQFSRRTFILNAPTIQSLKRGGMAQNEDRPPSTFSSISAFVWACIARSKSFSPNDETIFGFLMDCRGRLNPPIPEGYFGNCVRPVFVKLLVRDLTAEDGLVPTCRAIRGSIDEVSKDPLRDCENWVPTFKTLPWDRVVNVTASPKFRPFETDFGWGRPDRFEPVSLNRDGEFSLICGKEEGTVQVSLNLNSNPMESFIKYFLGGLSEYRRI